jgi:hypothetical protein
MVAAALRRVGVREPSGLEDWDKDKVRGVWYVVCGWDKDKVRGVRWCVLCAVCCVVSVFVGRSV